MRFFELMQFFENSDFLSFEQAKKPATICASEPKYDYIRLIAFDKSVVIKHEIGSEIITQHIATQTLRLFRASLR